MTLILASASKARADMLAAAGLRFETATARVDEEEAKMRLLSNGAAPRDIAAGLAMLKAGSLGAPGGALVIGADQVLETDSGEMLSKPRSRGEALEHLRLLSGRRHLLHSAAAAAVDGLCVWSGMESAEMTMRPLSEAFLGAYLEREFDAVRWSVGGYRIEGEGVQLFDRIEGSHFAILGLPLLPLLAFLRDRDVVPS